MKSALNIDRGVFVGLVAAIASCHGGELRMVAAPTEPETTPDGGAPEAGGAESAREACDDATRARKCSDLGCSTDEELGLECVALRKRLRASAFNRFVACAIETHSCVIEGGNECLDFREGVCIDSSTREGCENTLRNCGTGGVRRRATRLTQAQCQAMASAIQPRYRTTFYSCAVESCDSAQVRRTCIREP